MGKAHGLGPALSCFCLGTLCTMWARLGLSCQRTRGREASAALVIPAFTAFPYFPATLADAPDEWVSPTNITWKRAKPAQLSPAQRAHPQNCKQINDCHSKALSVGVACYTAKAMWYTDLLITTVVNQTWRVLFFYFPSYLVSHSAQKSVRNKLSTALWLYGQCPGRGCLVFTTSWKQSPRWWGCWGQGEDLCKQSQMLSLMAGISTIISIFLGRQADLNL